MNPDLENLLTRTTSIPTLSAVAVSVLQHCRSEDLNFNELGQIVSRDPALAIKILKMANSAIFSLPNEVRSISQAIGLLGLNCVRTLALSFSLVRDSAQERQGPLAAFWKRSVISSIAARELCEGMNLETKEEAFLAGLLQDVGIMAFARTFGSRYQRLYAQHGSNHDGLRAAEVSEFGSDHAEVGAWLLERWGVPKRLARIIRHSHDSRLLMGVDSELFAIACRVEYSGRMADLLADGPADGTLQIAEVEAVALFGEGRIDISGLGTRILASLTAIAPLFELKFDDDELAQMLEQAQDATALSVMRLQTALVTLECEATRDALTGLFNRGSLDGHLRQRFNGPSMERMGVLFVDIDNFKRINDTYGHSAGDTVIRTVAQRLRACARAADFVGRYGGEEFVLVVEVENAEDIVAIGERLRTAVERMPISITLDTALPVTVSVGCVTAVPGWHQDCSALLDEADQALYTAKHVGRNQVVRARSGSTDRSTCVGQ